MRLVFVSDSFIPKCPRELLWLVQAHRPVFGSVKLAPIKYEKSFVPRHMKSDERLFWKSTDHSAITYLSINGIDVSKRGPSFWKFSCSLVNDNNYCDLFDTNIKSWLEEFKDVDKRVLWDLLKYKIRQLTINYSESICLSRVEGRGFHVEGEGTMSRRNAKPTLSLSFCRGSRVEGRVFHVEGNIFFFPIFFFFGKGNNQCNQCHKNK